jgi:putative aldouronate transport system permease protein
MPILATLALFNVVGYWNSWFGAIIYITRRELWPLQLVLREIVVQGHTDQLFEAGQTAQDIVERPRPFTIQMAAIIIGTLPILCAYPFMQKYFMKGLVLGGVKE